MLKIDFKREIPTYRARLGVCSTVEVPPIQYLAIDGRGDPNSSAAYRDALAALYPVAYRVKFLSRADVGHDYVVMPLEALWWSDDLSSFTRARDRSRWEWTLLTMVPGWVTVKHLDAGRAAVAGVRLQTLEEGLSVQTLHVGPYDDEGPVIEAMHAFITAEGLRLTGYHHEVYLDDARRTPPTRLRTILRQPVARTS